MRNRPKFAGEEIKVVQLQVKKEKKRKEITKVKVWHFQEALPMLLKKKGHYRHKVEYFALG